MCAWHDMAGREGGRGMKKKLAMMLGLILTIGSLAGCGGTKDANTTADTKTAEETEETVVAEEGEGQAQGEADAQADTDNVLKDGNVVTLKVVCPGGTASPGSKQEVEAAINEIIAPVMDAVIEFEFLEWGVFQEQKNLILSSGEDYALVFTFDSSRNYATSHQVLDITDLLPVYAPGLTEEMQNYFDACKIGGRMYGVPTFHEYASRHGITGMTSVLDELSIDPESIKTWDDVDAMLAKVHEAHPDMNCLIPVDTNKIISGAWYNAKISQIIDGVGVYVEGDPLNVVNMYATPEYMDEVAKRVYDWNQKGYVIADASTIPEVRQELLAAGNSFAFCGGIHPGTKTQEAKNAGVDVTTMPIDRPVLNTSSVDFAQYMVPTACSTPEKAVKLLDLMYTNPDIVNLISYGIEGKDYEIKDAEKNIVGYPAGVDSSSVGWNNETWLVGNGALGYVWETDDPDIWEQYKDLNENSVKSCIFGFTFDPSNVKTQVTAIQNVVSKYGATIGCGYADPEESVAKFVEELEAAGINDVIEEAKTQIQAWMDANG